MHRSSAAPRGCVSALLLGLLVLWYVFVTLALESLNLGTIVFLVAQLTLHLALFVPLAWLGRNGRWSQLSGAAFGLAAVAGLVAVTRLFGALVGTAHPSVMLLVTLAYGLLLTPVYAVWRGISLGDALREIGVLRSFNARLLLFGLAVGLPLAAPWVVVGALGSSAQIGAALLQTLTTAVGIELLARGIVLSAFRVGGARNWAAIVWAALLGVFATTGVSLATAQAPINTGLALFEALPAGILFGVVQVGVCGYLPATMLVAALFHGVSLLFVDPRSTAEITFLLVRLALWILALGTAGVLVLIRSGVVAERARPPRAQLARPLLTAATLAAIVGGLYVGLGSPGVYEDGFVVVLNEQADLSGAAAIPDRVERARFVYAQLTETATRTQAPVRAELEQQGLPYRPYYLVNMIRVDARPGYAAAFANRPDVARIEQNPNSRRYRYKFPDIFPTTDAGTGVEPSLETIGVPEAWALGVPGAGVLVGGADTGYQWDHPALKRQYAGWDGSRADHNYHWHDSWENTEAPFDDGSHGTHTMGTMVGDDGAGNQIGIAPEARWIGCRNMRNGLGNPASYIECMEFLLAPYPHNGDPFRDGDPARAPVVVNNSWGCPLQEGCQPDTLLPALDHLRAAGVFMVVSAGNSGPACSTIDTAPSQYRSVFSVGALENDDPRTPQDEALVATDFSSRGPVTVDGSGRVKPDISAPGADIRSSIPGGYGVSSGTSMAGPHVVGLVALVVAAQPALAGNIDAIEQLLRTTAVPIERQSPVCGADDVVPNDTYGAGAIDVAAAVRAALGR